MEDFNLLIEKIMAGEKNLSYSSLKAFLESPRKFKEYKTNPKQTDAMIQGIRFHKSCLEPDIFKQQYWCLDDTEKIQEIGGKNPRGTNKYKEWKQEQINSHEGEMIPIDEYNMYLNMSKALRNNRATAPLMKNLIETEQKFTYELDGFNLSGSIDGRGHGLIDEEERNYLIDIKKVANAAWEKVKWDIRRKKYHMQAALYTKASGIKDYYLVYIDSSLEILKVKLTQETIDDGFLCLENGLVKFYECAETDSWDCSYEFFNNGYILY